MQERTRYRVTGSIFLLSVLVLVLPMIFDRPADPVSEMPAPPAPASSQMQTSNSVTERAAQLPEFEQLVPDDDGSSSEGAGSDVAERDVVEQVRQLAAEVDDEGFSNESGTRFGEPELSEPTAQAVIWAVQAAAFASQENAFDFRAQLREAGYEAFISTRKISDVEDLHRVAVGPLLSEADANRIQQEIAKTFSVEGRVMEMER